MNRGLGTATDNGLVEAKNGAVIRTHRGHTTIPAPHAAAIKAFYERYFNPYLNFLTAVAGLGGHLKGRCPEFLYETELLMVAHYIIFLVL
jgi:hypothetical protein